MNSISWSFAEALDKALNDSSSSTVSSGPNYESLQNLSSSNNSDNGGKNSGGGKMTAAEVKEMILEKSNNTGPAASKNKVYGSVAEMKRSKVSSLNNVAKCQLSQLTSISFL